MKPILYKVDAPDETRSIRRRPTEATEWHSLLGKAVRNPGQWYEVWPQYDSPGAASSAAYEIKSGRNKSVPEGLWDTASRTRGSFDEAPYGVLFVRYLGAK